MLDDEMLGQLFLKLLVSCSRSRRHFVVAVSEYRRFRFTRVLQTRRKRTCRKAHRRQGISTCNIKALRGVLRSVHGLVLNCMPNLALGVFTWHFDDNSATRWLVKKCGRPLSKNPRTFTLAGAHQSPVMHRLSVNLRSSSGGAAAKVLLASPGVMTLAASSSVPCHGKMERLKYR